MARKSIKSATEAAVRSTSKRAAPETPSRQSKRAKSTTRKSYAEPESDDDIDKTIKPDSGSDAASDFEAEDDEEEVQSSEHDIDEASSEGESSKKTTARGRNAKTSTLPVHKKKSTDKELWKQGATLEPGTRVVIKKPKAREAGDTPYTDDTIHPNTMLFLRDLAVNNDRQWLKAHDPDYRTSLQDFNTFLESLTEKVIEADETIPELPVKDIIFRIYRDIRFSKDPTPYKLGAGRKGPYAAYYVQIQPKGGSFVGGGLWMPEAQALSKIRQDIDRKPHKIKRVLSDAGIRESFFGGISNDEKKAIKAFTNQSSNKSNALKKHPKGYAADHKDIELLRLRNFTLGTKLRDDEVVGAKGLERIAGLIETMVPFITYLNSVVMPDEASDDEDEDEGDLGDLDEGSSGADVDEDGSGDA